MSVCQVEEIFTHLFTPVRIDVKCQRERSLLPVCSEAEEQMLPFCLTLPEPLCVAIASPSVLRRHIKLVGGWEREC